MKTTNKPRPKKTTPPKEEAVLTKENFLKVLDKVILTVKPSKSPARGKKGTSE
jgi:hypothetical protein